VSLPERSLVEEVNEVLEAGRERGLGHGSAILVSIPAPATLGCNLMRVSEHLLKKSGLDVDM
jgi:hypothetical protein